MKIKFVKLHTFAITPTYATSGAACFDLYVPKGWGSTRLIGDVVIDTGLAVEVPPGYAMMIYSRSGMGFSHGVRLANCTGVIDSDYRGEIKVKLTQDAGSDWTYVIESGQRIAQAMIIPVPQIELIEVLKLSDTDRGDAGFGSTGQ